MSVLYISRLASRCGRRESAMVKADEMYASAKLNSHSSQKPGKKQGFECLGAKVLSIAFPSISKLRSHGGGTIG